MKYRQIARRLSLTRRFLALTAQEKVLSDHCRNAMYLIVFKLKQNVNNPDKRRRLQKVLKALMVKYLAIVVEPEIEVEKPLRLDKTIDSFTDSQCWIYFATRKNDLRRLLNGLRIPESVVLENRSRLSGEEILLRGLYELVSGQTQYSISNSVFGRDWSQQSRATKWFINHIYSTFLFLVTNNLEWWWNNGYIHQSLDAIKRKMNWTAWNPNDCTVMGFLDCNCLETSRVGSGPSEEGSDSTRWDPTIQQAFYNGWKSIHGLKHQTFDIAHGFTVDMFGPTSLRRNDLKLLALSQIIHRLRDLQKDEEIKLGIFGDSIYPYLDVLKSYHKGNNLNHIQIEENKRFKSVRISIEWNYMTTSNIYGYLQNLEKLQLLQSSNVSKVYIVCTILRNCHVALYGCQSSSYFNLTIDDLFLERYLRVNA